MDKKKKIMLAVLGAMVVTLLAVSGYYWYMSSHYVQTDDARVDATIVKVSPQISGKITEMYVAEGDSIKEGDTIARQVDFTLAKGANLDMAVIKTPVSGTVVKKIGNVGEVGVPGQPLAMVADLNSVYLSANIEETELNKVRSGQFVDFNVDAFPGVNFTGEVTSIGEATNSVFSLLPTQNTGGNYTKVVQRIPVKIAISDYKGCRLLPGMNAIVKIHLK
ncbi:MAG: hemolysin D [Peptococcaceae bacterium BRH_c4b]|nr:MAG: hemolysin D [Peptococcaceae bacterium BRH_c4b]